MHISMNSAQRRKERKKERANNNSNKAQRDKSEVWFLCPQPTLPNMGILLLYCINMRLLLVIIL